MPRQSNCSRLTALGCVVLAGGLLVPPRAFAEPATRSTPILDAARLAADRHISARHTAGRHAATMTARSAAEAQQAPATATDLRSGSFFKSAAGVATLVIFAAGVGYALYSSSNDRIRSTGR
jgi:hypothetical protein